VQREKYMWWNKEPTWEHIGSWRSTDKAWEGAENGFSTKRIHRGPSESSWQTCKWEERTQYSWKPRLHDWDYLQHGGPWWSALDKAEGVWEDEDGDHHEIKLQVWDPPARWICKPRRWNQQQPIQAVLIEYNAEDGMCWWGDERNYFFDPSDMVKKRDYICWYSHDDWNKSWPAFTWYRIKQTSTNRIQQQLEHNEIASGQKAAASGVTKGVDTTGNAASDAREGGWLQGSNRHVHAAALHWVPRVHTS